MNENPGKINNMGKKKKQKKKNIGTQLVAASPWWVLGNISYNARDFQVL